MSVAAPTKESVTHALRGVVDPASRRDVVTLGYVRNVAVCDGVARVVYAIPADAATEPLRRNLSEQTKAAIGKLPGMRAAEIEWLAVGVESNTPLPGVRYVIAVGAGKGGVGKSTVALALAVGLRRMGLRAGILDADVYGPSIPKMTGTEGAQPETDEQGRILPPVSDGMPIMSMGYFVQADQAVVWRGPMAQKYVKEFLDRGTWGMLDYLIVDLPPGTGDIPLTLAQTIPLTGAVIVCTPQDVALLDAIKAVRMFQKLGVDVLGIVENMSYYVCPQCGNRAEIFDHGGCEDAARTLNVPFLGGIPLNIAIRRNSDAGVPADNFTKTEPHVIAGLEHMVTRLNDIVAERAAQRAPQPTLRIT